MTDTLASGTRVGGIGRMLPLVGMAALVAALTVGVQPPVAHAAAAVTTAGELQVGLNAGGWVALGANITSGAVSVGNLTTSTLDLNGKKLTVTGAPGSAGIGVPAGSTLIIMDSSAGASGELHAYGGTNAAGIGGGAEDAGGTIVITGGTVTATGGGDDDFGSAVPAGGAGIGGGAEGAGGTITITGGSVTATGRNLSAGIGGSRDKFGGTVIVQGGTVKATGAHNGAGIGGGHSNLGSTVLIMDGHVTATGGNFGAGIGGGQMGNGADDIEITGGEVQAYGGANGAGIGGGSGTEDKRASGNIHISGGSVTAIGGAMYSGGAGIGGGTLRDGGNITVSGGSVTATGRVGGAGIGGGANGNGGDVEVSGGTVTVTAGSGSAIGHGLRDIGGADFGSLTIGADGVVVLRAELKIVGATTVKNDGTIRIGPGGSISDPKRIEGNRYAISFDLNGGNGSQPSASTVYAPSLAAAAEQLPDPDPRRDGFAFTGWFNAASDGDQLSTNSPLSDTLFDGNTTTAGQSTPSATVYAQWNPIHTDTVDLGGGVEERPNEDQKPDDRPEPSEPDTRPIDSPPYSDVPAGHPHDRGIRWLQQQGITKPDGDQFKPAAAVTRGQVAAFLFRLANPGKTQPGCTDNGASGHRFCGYLAWAATTGLLTGSLRPDAPLTRGAIATILYRLDGGATSPRRCDPGLYPDVTRNQVHCKAITWAKHTGLIVGHPDGTYRPDQPVTRGALATILYRYHTPTGR